jgi:hypothetical protein
MVNARLTCDSNAVRVGRGPMPKVTNDSLWRETANNRARPLWDPELLFLASMRSRRAAAAAISRAMKAG